MATTRLLRPMLPFLVMMLLPVQAWPVSEDMWDSVFVYQSKMANYGNADAQFRLGEMYEEGRGTAKDIDKALAWYRKAAEQGNLAARSKIEQLKNPIQEGS